MHDYMISCMSIAGIAMAHMLVTAQPDWQIAAICSTSSFATASLLHPGTFYRVNMFDMIGLDRDVLDKVGDDQFRPWGVYQQTSRTNSDPDYTVWRNCRPLRVSFYCIKRPCLSHVVGPNDAVWFAVQATGVFAWSVAGTQCTSNVQHDSQTKIHMYIKK